MTFRLVVYLLGFAPFLWVVNSMFNEIVFSRYFWKQKLYCWKCITFWISLIILITLTDEIILSMCIASILSFVAYKLDNKINTNKKGEIKL